MQHQLVDHQFGRITTLYCEGTTLNTTTEANGKAKTSSKAFATAADAQQQLIKKEWELLKKGAVLQDANAETGTPLLHLYMGLGYTGCLSFISTPHGIFVYQFGGKPGETVTHDNLLCIDTQGNVKSTLKLPRVLPWEICYDAKSDQLLLDIDHYIYQYNFATECFTQLTHQLDKPASFATIGGDVWAYGSHPQYFIDYRDGNQPKQFELEATILNGSIPMAAKLSPNGQTLALHNVEGEIKLIDTMSKKAPVILNGDFKRLHQLLWTNDGSQLIAHQQYTGTALTLFDVATGSTVKYDGLKLPTYTQDVTDCCLNANNTLLVCVQRTTAYVFDFTSKTFLHSFAIQHCVKTAQVKFIDNSTLGVRTDYGCFSIYQL